MIRVLFTALPVLTLVLLSCSSPVDISGVYVCDDHRSGFSIEPIEDGYKVTSVILENGRIAERLFSYTIPKSPNNHYRIYTEAEKINYYDVKASSSGFNGVYRNTEKQFMVRALIALLRKTDL